MGRIGGNIREGTGKYGRIGEEAEKGLPQGQRRKEPFKSESRDLNPGPLAPDASALSHCATLRIYFFGRTSLF
jgi:hypothetical protein